MGGDRDAFQIIFVYRLFTAAPTFWRALGCCVLLQDRPSPGRPQRNIAAADETKRSVIEVVAVEFVNRLTQRAGAHERVHIFVEEHVDRRRYLVGVCLLYTSPSPRDR